MEDGIIIIFILVCTGFIIFILIKFFFIFVEACCQCRKDLSRSYIANPVISNPMFNEIQMDNGSQYTSAWRNQQTSFSTVLNHLEYENSVTYDGLHELPRHQYNAQNHSITNSTISQFNSGLSCVVLNTVNGRTFSGSSIEDPPPSYDECMASYHPKPQCLNLPAH